MAKTVLGIDVGHDQLKMALVRGQSVLKTAYAEMPDNLLKEGRITSKESLSELIRHTMKENGIRANRAAFVLANESVFIKNVDVPRMTAQQLEYNLPYEFNDYITGEIKDYVFDYAVLNGPKTETPAAKEKSKGLGVKLPFGRKKAEAGGESAETKEDSSNGFSNDGAASNAVSSGFGSEEDEINTQDTLELMAVGTLRSVVDDAQEVLRKAGLRMIKAAPTLCTYISLIRARQEYLSRMADEYAMLDLGYSAIRMYMYKGDRHVATRILEIGLSSVENAIADVYGVDIHLARTYIRSNFEDCLQRAECQSAYENIAVELMRALNFYRFSNPDNALADLWLCGGGAVIKPLGDIIGEMLNIQIHAGSELVPGGEEIPGCGSFVQAIGITMD